MNGLCPICHNIQESAGGLSCSERDAVIPGEMYILNQLITVVNIAVTAQLPRLFNFYKKYQESLSVKHLYEQTNKILT